MATYSIAAVLDAAAKVVAGAIDGHVFAAGVTQEVTTAAPTVVPIADDFTQVGFPIVLLTLGAWHPALLPGLERYGNSDPLQLLGSVWVPRFPLAEAVQALLGYRDAIVDAWIDHTKAGLVVAELQAAVLAGGPGLVPQKVGEQEFLTLPFTVNVTLNRSVTPKPE